MYRKSLKIKLPGVTKIVEKGGTKLMPYMGNSVRGTKLMPYMGNSVQSVCKRTFSVCFFVIKRTNYKLPFARWANGKWIKENRLGFRYPSEKAAYKYKHEFIHTFTRETELTENGNFRLFAAIGKLKRQTSVCLLQTETGNGKRKFVFLGLLTINGNRRLCFSQRAHLCLMSGFPILTQNGISSLNE